MPIITDIQPQKKNKDRVNIYIDGSFFCGLNYLAAVDFKIKIGDSIDTDNFSSIIFESEKKTAYDKALDYVLRGYKTKKQLQEYLSQKGFQDSIIQFAVDYLLQLGYINDLEYAKTYVKECKLKSKALVAQELYHKGIAKSYINAALEDFDSEEENCKMLAARHLSGKKIDKIQRQKTIMYLANKGFDFDTIKRVVEEILEDVDGI